MEDKICILFGCQDAPYCVLERIKETAEQHYLEYGVRTFVVGNRGNFDKYAITAMNALKDKYQDICILLQLSCDPLLEDMYREFAILEENPYIVREANTFICYIPHLRDDRKLSTYAEKMGIIATNIAL